MKKIFLFLTSFSLLFFMPTTSLAASCQAGATFCNTSEKILYKAVNSQCLYTPVSTGCTSQPVATSSYCQVSWSNIPSSIGANSTFNTTITQGQTNVDWANVALYLDGTKLSGGSIATSNSYHWSIPARSVGTHTLKFRTRDTSAGYTGPISSIDCTPTTSFTTTPTPTDTSKPTPAPTNTPVPTKAPTPTPIQATTFIGYTLSDDLLTRDSSTSPAVRTTSLTPSQDFLLTSSSPGTKTIFVRFFYSDGSHIDSQQSIIYSLSVTNTPVPTIAPTSAPKPQPNLLTSDIQSGTIDLSNLLASGTLGNMQNATVPANNQNVQWFGDTSTPATGGLYKVTGSSDGGSIRTDIYEPQAEANPNKFDSSSPSGTQFHVGGKQYFAVIERAGSSQSTFSNVDLYRSDQHIQWFGSSTNGAPGTYNLSGTVSGDGVIQVDIYKNGGYEKTVSGTFTVNTDEYFAVIERAFSGHLTFTYVKLIKE